MENYLPYSKWNVLQSPCSPNGVCRHPSRCNFNTKLGPLVVGVGGGGGGGGVARNVHLDGIKRFQQNDTK